MWNKKDYKGTPVTYYEEKEYKELEEKFIEYRKAMYNMYKVCNDDSVDLEHYFYGVLKSLNLLDDFYKKRETENDM